MAISEIGSYIKSIENLSTLVTAEGAGTVISTASTTADDSVGSVGGSGGGSSDSDDSKTTTEVIVIDGVTYLQTTTTENGVETVTRTIISQDNTQDTSKDSDQPTPMTSNSAAASALTAL